MEINVYILFVILGASIVTFIPRVIPLIILSKIQIPEWGINWLKQVPVAVMAALLAQELLLADQVFSVKDNIVKLGAAIPSFAVAILTRSLMITVLVGILSLMALRILL
ncbi:AzlD domain-containing protein [Peribacillus sp. NPDC097675]|uniref:AzlD domain-containing protein n=1 Tax=Peribacillus sp. NPDC097675 TaxID=3390618 RepID=UPI003CFFC8C8